MFGPGLAERRIVEAAYRSRHPEATFAVEHRVVVVEARVPNRAVAPIGRGHRRPLGRGVAVAERQLHVGIAYRARKYATVLVCGSRIGNSSVEYSGEP